MRRVVERMQLQRLAGNLARTWPTIGDGRAVCGGLLGGQKHLYRSAWKLEVDRFVRLQS